MKLTSRIFFIGMTYLFSVSHSAMAENLSFKLFDGQDKLVCDASSPITKGKAEIKLNFERDFQEGDYLLITGSNYLYINLKDSVKSAYVYAPDKSFRYILPLKERGQTIPLSAFSGKSHQIEIRSCSENEWKVSRNIALNPFDIRGVSKYYPHTTSNSEYGNQSVFAAKNVIDGFSTNQNHGKWPFQSWGPYKADSIWLKIDFGKVVQVDKIVIVNRAQFSDNHDSSWKNASLEFSDGTTEKITFKKTNLPQEIKIKKRKTSTIKFHELKAFEDNWCSWIEVEVWGKY